MARIIGDEPGYIRPAVYPGSPKKTIVPVPVYHPPKPVAPPPGTGGGGGGGGKPAGPPDYMALLKGSPAYQAWLQNANFRKTGLTNQRAAAIRQLILQFGGLPKGFKDAFGDLRPEDMAAAEANQFGAEQSIERAYQQGREQMHRSLAGRGMLSSGDLGFGEGEANLERGRQEFDAGQNFMSALNQAVGDWTQGIGNVGGEEAGLIAQLLPQIREMYPYNPGAGGGGAAPGGGGGGATVPLRTAVPRANAPVRPRRPALRKVLAPKRPRQKVTGRQP